MISIYHVHEHELLQVTNKLMTTHKYTEYSQRFRS